MSYNKDKVAQFKNAFQEYKVEMENFKSEMNIFKNTMDFMEGNLSKEGENVGNSNYVINKDGILMKRAGQTWGYDNSVNTVIDITNEKKAFVTNVAYEGDAASINETNRLYQVGLDDLTYDNSIENTLTGNDRYVNITMEPDISDNRDCNLNHLYQCSAKAKMENKPYYGIEGGKSMDNQEICNCYIFDKQPTDTISENIKTINVNSTDTAFLATLMDGKFYGIKKTIYSDNYNGFYKSPIQEPDESTDNTLEEIIHTELESEVGLNPFTGNGINTIEITALANNCTAAG